MKYPFRNLVLSGGGIWGIAYVGMNEVLEKEGITPNIQRVAGVSAGAIFSTLMSLGYSSKELMHIVRTTDFHSFEDSASVLRIFTKYGFFKGDVFLNWMRERIAESPAGNGDPNLTFEELHKATGRELYVFATDLNTQTFQEFSARMTPHFKVAEAVRASMSIPLVFQAWRFPDAKGHMNVYCDGGMMNNYPINFFDVPPFLEHGKLSNPETLGFMFVAPPTNAQRPDDGLNFGDFHTYMKALVESILIGVGAALKVPGNLERTVMTDAHATHISPVNFKIKKVEIDLLLETGRRSITEYLANYNKEVPKGASA